MVNTALPEGEAAPDLFFMDMKGVPWDGTAGVPLVAPWDGLLPYERVEWTRAKMDGWMDA